jgi:transposase
MGCVSGKDCSIAEEPVHTVRVPAFAMGRHEVTAVEFLNDWEAIFIVLEHPHLPLTNSEAERALRHWVIWRRISYGTRTPVGSKSFALLASVIDTCRRRNASPWPYLAQVIAARRRGLDVPPLPPAQPSLP